MRIAVVSSLFAPYGLGGAEEVAAQLAANMRNLGHTVDVVSTCRRNELNGQPYRMDVWNGIRVWRIAPWNLYWRFDRETQQPGPLRRAAWHFVDLWNPSTIAPLRAVLQRIRPDVVNTHNIDGFSPVVWQVARDSSPVIHTLHDYHLLCPRAILQRRDGTLCGSLCGSCRAYAAFNHLFERYVDAVIAPSRAAACLHEAEGWRSPVLIPNAVDPEEIVLPARVSGDPLEVVFMSRLVPEKGCETLMRVMEHFRDVEHIHFHVAGKGPQEGHFQGLARDRTNFTWHGFVTGRSKTALLSAGDVFLQLSEWPENAPLAVIEAKQSGLHLVGVNIGGIPELISSDMEGRLIGPRDPAGLIRVLKELIDERDSLRAGRKARIEQNRGYGPMEMTSSYLRTFASFAGVP
jgi:glycosyltransferase involved in cell wall biosynthesis